MEKYKFERKIIPGREGYEVVCRQTFTDNGKLNDAIAALHFHEGDINQDIPEKIKLQLINEIKKTKYASR